MLINSITLEEIKLHCQFQKESYNVQNKNYLQYQITLITSVPLPIKFKRASLINSPKSFVYGSTPLHSLIRLKSITQNSPLQEQPEEERKMRDSCKVSIVLLLVLINGVFGDNPYRFFTWKITYGDIYPLGVKQQVFLLFLFFTFLSFPEKIC